jgi:riboflavin synthase
MFTGIIETTATIREISHKGSNKTFRLSSPLAAELKVDQSVAHNGVCLTVEAIKGEDYQVTAIAETLEKTNLGGWQTGDAINLERCLQPSGRLDGHFVQGHTDTRGMVLEKKDMNGSWLFSIGFPAQFAPLMIEKGSVAVNGISLTAFDVANDRFSVAIIPYTYQHTNLNQVEPGQAVNIEFDMLGKYMVRWAETRPGRNVL